MPGALRFIIAGSLQSQAEASHRVDIAIGSGAIETSSQTRASALSGALGYQYNLNSSFGIRANYLLVRRSNQAGSLTFQQWHHRLHCDGVLTFRRPAYFAELGMGISPALIQIIRDTENSSYPTLTQALMGLHGFGLIGIPLNSEFDLGLLFEAMNRNELVDANAQIVLRKIWGVTSEE